MRSVHALPALLVTVLAGGLLAVPATAAPVYDEVSALIYDDTGDETSGQAGRDVSEAFVRSDPNTGRFYGTVTFAAAPTPAANAELRVFYGSWTPDDVCLSDVFVSAETAGAGRATARVADEASRGAVDIAPYDATERPPESAKVAGAEVSYSARSADLVGSEFTCAFVRVVAIGSPEQATTIYDVAGADTLYSDGDALLIADGNTVRLKKGKAGKVTFTIENLNEVTARQVKVAFTADKGVKLKKRSASISAIGPDQKAKVSVGVVSGKVGEREVRAKVTAPNSDVDYGFATVQVSPKPFTSTGSLAGTYQWGNTISPLVGWDIHGVFFVNKQYAYRGFPKRGVPSCSKVTAKPGGDGCVRYWYDKKKKRIQVDNERGTFKKGVISFGGEQYGLDLVSPRKGSKIDAHLQFIDSFGCPGVSCVSYSSTLDLNPNGTYDIGGSETGRYQVGKRGKTVFTDASGKKRTRTLSLGATKGKPNIDKRGLILDARYWYR